MIDTLKIPFHTSKKMRFSSACSIFRNTMKNSLPRGSFITCRNVRVLIETAPSSSDAFRFNEKRWLSLLDIPFFADIDDIGRWPLFKSLATREFEQPMWRRFGWLLMRRRKLKKVLTYSGTSERQRKSKIPRSETPTKPIFSPSIRKIIPSFIVPFWLWRYDIILAWPNTSTLPFATDCPKETAIPLQNPQNPR